MIFFHSHLGAELRREIAAEAARTGLTTGDLIRAAWVIAREQMQAYRLPLRLLSDFPEEPATPFPSLVEAVLSSRSAA